MLKLLFAALAAAIVASSPAVAGEAAKLKCKTAHYNDGVIAQYKCNGDYKVSLRGYPDQTGKYTLKGDRVCVDFQSGKRRCDTVLPGNKLRSKGGMVFTFTLRP